MLVSVAFSICLLPFYLDPLTRPAREAHPNRAHKLKPRRPGLSGDEAEPTMLSKVMMKLNEKLLRILTLMMTCPLTRTLTLTQSPLQKTSSLMIIMLTFAYLAQAKVQATLKLSSKSL